MGSRYVDTITGEKLYINIDRFGSKFYYKDKKKTIQHRIDGPALESADGDKAWWVNGKSHRNDGPAVEFAEGDKSWYVNGIFIFSLSRSNKLSKKMR
jgi:hypothetical protein